MEFKFNSENHLSNQNLLNYLDLYETEIGSYYLPKNSEKDIVCQAMRKGQLFDKKIIDQCRKLYLSKNNPNAIMIDIGANFAQMSVEFSKFPLLLSSSSHRKPTVYSFEAEPFVYEIALLNIHANNKKERINLFHNAVWNINNLEVCFPEPDFSKMDSWGSFGLEPSLEAGRMIKTITIDSLKFDEEIAFMKIDIQGSDLNALLGSVETIRKHKMPIIFEYEQMFSDKFKNNFQDYVDFVQCIDYRFEKVIENNYVVVSN